MLTSTCFLAASSFLALSMAAPIPKPVERRGGMAFSKYTVFGGDGTTLQGWPSQNQWWPFEDLWDANLEILRTSCTQYPGSPQNNDENEIAAIKQAIIEVSGESGLSKEYILASMMQESKGCVRAPTTNYGVRNPGLMQSFNGKATCNEGGFTTPCPDSTIKQMVSEGVGLGLEFGLTQALGQAGCDDVSKYYKAARIYNSGSLPQGGNLGSGIATHCYSTDIANRLVGWTSQSSACQEGTIGSVGGSNVAFGGSDYSNGNGNGNGNSNTPEPTTTPTITEPPAAVKTPEVEPPKAETPKVEPPKAETPKEQTPKPVNAPTSEKAPGAAANCKSWYAVKKGDDCSATGISFERLRTLNTQLDSNCSNLWAEYSYCIDA
ncbi:carbohydrate-binding module family 50 protein [Aaosphaeria arxii CBS 175.79]|uniref:Carbohydrate-binding module family 50 protein n=1 Tax=Aaosphaeria arxii CBS 175.79 TaxID=1450172 RepID=A0A6A5Y211_9PLEO|nr:carbohydrate-binding module family 50 protein [Aaosphaeria arxii CBS 175.79]KAF2019276.1 carbohydrate-binding module family 50 protein [Aaosphaeria arxii CBS 175.79]